MKTCKTCSVLKPLSDFYKNSGMRDGILNSCKPCVRRKQDLKNSEPEVRKRRSERARKWREENQDVLRQKNRLYYQENRDAVLERNRAWASQNRDKVNLASRKWRSLNYSQSLEMEANWRSRNRDHLRQYKRDWYWDRGGKSKYVGYASTRKAIKLSLSSERVSVRDVALRDGAWCWLCGDELSDFDPSHMDHLIPLAADPELLAVWGVENPGTVLANMALACPSCNIRKSNKILPCAIARYLRNLEPIEAAV